MGGFERSFKRRRNGGDFQSDHSGRKTFPSGVMPCNAQHEMVLFDDFDGLFIIPYGGIAKENSSLSDLEAQLNRMRIC